MKTLNFILLVIAISTISNYDCYSAKDTLPPNPTFRMCPYCGEFVDELVEDMPNDSTRSNMGTIVFDTINSYNFRFTYEEFIPGEDSYTHWHAWIYDHSKDSRLVVTFTDFAGNDTTLLVNFYAAKFTISPNLDFGIVPIGEVKEMDCWIINESSFREDSVDTLIIENRTKGFEILDIDYPFIIKPLDSIKFRVRFTATANGEFRDTINIILTHDDWAGYRKKASIKALVASAIINVSYYDFGDVPVNSSANGTIEIRNLGTIELKISGYTGPRQLSIFIPDLTIDNTLRLAPNEVYTYEVRFLPLDTIVYTDSMFFISNSKKGNTVDSVGDLRGRGIKPELVANGYDWGRRRIDRHEFPVEPYPPDSGYQVIKLINGGTQAVAIYNINILSDINGNAFEFNRGLFINQVIQEKDSIIVPVLFHPTTPCLHELIFSYDNSAQSTTQTVLRGFGTVPQLETENYDFGTTKLMDTANPNSRLIRITNKSATDWPCGDSATIFDLKVLPNGNEISTNIANWGTEGFRYEKSALVFPIKLAQGEYIEFIAQFVARKESQSLAYLESVSDAEEEVTSKWTGSGIIDVVTDNSNNKYEINISPNPADDVLSIDFQDIKFIPGYIKFFDMYGNVVYENRNVNENNLKINTSELASGMYFLQVGNVGLRKVLVVH